MRRKYNRIKLVCRYAIRYFRTFELPPLSVFLDAVTENATVKRAQSEVEQVKNEYRLQKRELVELF